MLVFFNVSEEDYGNYTCVAMNTMGITNASIILYGKNISISVANIYIIIRAVKVIALIYAINVAAINAIKYFNAVNATLFTSGVRCPLTRNRRVPT